MTCQVKICGIRTPHIAEVAMRAGADFIGMIFYPPSRRSIDIDQAKEIVSALAGTGVIPVAVFVDAPATTMTKTMELLGIDHVQLHGDVARQQVNNFPGYIHRIFVIPVSRSGEYDRMLEISSLCRERDYLLYDYTEPGSGQNFDWAVFKNEHPFRFFLAGGLNAENVRHAIEKIRPTVVDVSSGVELPSGEKSAELIEQFISQVKQ